MLPVVVARSLMLQDKLSYLHKLTGEDLSRYLNK